MRIRNRLFPYPVLNNNELLSDYRSGNTFELVFDGLKTGEMIVDGQVVLSNVRIDSSNCFIADLMREGKVRGLLVIECSESVFRHKYDISFKPRNISIPVSHFNGKVEISAFIYAAEDITLKSNESFQDEYSDFSFEVEQYCILAADDSISITVDNQPETDNKSSSIFTIVCNKDAEDLLMKGEITKNKILIHLPQEQYDEYNSIKNTEDLRNASFATIAIPVLTESLATIKELMRDENGSTFDDVCEQYKWFRSVLKAYERVTHAPLKEEDFLEEIQPLVLAQIILNNASCNGIIDLSNLAAGNTDDDEEDINE